MSKGKLKKFNENLTFSCLYQPAFYDVFSSKSEMCGKWASDYFHNSNPIVLELGCGYGEYTVAMAKRNPEKNFIGLDIKGARIWRGAKTVEEENIKNAAFIRTRIECITNLFEEGEISEIWLTFPDPQNKRSRADKRLTSPMFLSRYSKIIRDGGIMHLKTDSRHLYEYTKSLLEANDITPLQDSDDIYSTFHDDALLTIRTHYEQLSLDLRVSIKYLSWEIPSGSNVSYIAPQFYGDIEEGTLDDDRPKPGKGLITKKSIKIDIDDNSGCCFGVVRALERAEEIISKEGSVASLGELVHNPRELARLQQKGLQTIEHSQIAETKPTILIRAHGEPPTTFAELDKIGHQYVDATCPVVKALQNKVRSKWDEMKKLNGQIVIFGKKGHAEVVGLAGQTEGNAIVIEKEEDLNGIDFSRPIAVVSQTTQSVDKYKNICSLINSKAEASVSISDTICHSVSGRVANLKLFAKQYDAIVFVAGHNSSNGKALFEESKKVNPNSYFVESIEELDVNWFKDCHKIGICGATSTPRRQMEEIKTSLKSQLEYS